MIPDYLQRQIKNDDKKYKRERQKYNKRTTCPAGKIHELLPRKRPDYFLFNFNKFWYFIPHAHSIPLDKKNPHSH